MASEVEICNLALNHLGGYRIQSLEDRNKQANFCKNLYPSLRDTVLEAHDWTFARKRITLALLSDESFDGWTYAYQLPNDCLNPRLIHNSVSNSEQDKIEFELVGNEAKNRRIILTNQVDAVLIYTAQTTDANMFSATFKDALAWLMASYLAVPLLGKANLQSQFFELYEISIGRARSSSANKGSKKPDDKNDYVEARL